MHENGNETDLWGFCDIFIVFVASFGCLPGPCWPCWGAWGYFAWAQILKAPCFESERFARTKRPHVLEAIRVRKLMFSECQIGTVGARALRTKRPSEPQRQRTELENPFWKRNSLALVACLLQNDFGDVRPNPYFENGNETKSRSNMCVLQKQNCHRRLAEERNLLIYKTIVVYIND